MAITYIEQYETKKAATEMSISDSKYVIEYIVTGPIDMVPDTVNATISRMEGEQLVRVGYAAFTNGVASVRFDSTATMVPVAGQATISTQFFIDLQSILE